MSKLDINEMFGNVGSDCFEGAMDVLLGGRLGTGAFRRVYPISHAKDKVIKLCAGDDMHSNVKEWEIWNAVRYMGEAKRKWFAECFSISNNGRALVQERVEVFGSVNDPRLPKKIPCLFTDTKVQNWGITERGQVKCIDYGLIHLLKPSPFRMVNASFWDMENDFNNDSS